MVVIVDVVVAVVAAVVVVVIIDVVVNDHKVVCLASLIQVAFVRASQPALGLFNDKQLWLTRYSLVTQPPCPPLSHQFVKSERKDY